MDILAMNRVLSRDIRIFNIDARYSLLVGSNGESSTFMKFATKKVIQKIAMATPKASAQK